MDIVVRPATPADLERLIAELDQQFVFGARGAEFRLHSGFPRCIARRTPAICSCWKNRAISLRALPANVLNFCAGATRGAVQ